MGGKSKNLDNRTIRMIRVEKKYNLELAAIRMSRELCSQLPAWYHLAAECRPLTGITPKCLLNCHQIIMVANLMNMSARLRDPELTTTHQPNLLCIYRECIRDRIKGCRQPYACAQEALMRLNLIIPKLNPLQKDNHGNLLLTRTRKTRNEVARANNDAILFNPTLTCKDDLSERLCIFTNPDRISNISATRLQGQGRALRTPKLTIYTDRACMNNGKEDACSGSGIWIGPNHPWNRAIRIPGPAQSNQIREITAIIVTASVVPTNWPIKIISDSKYTIDGLTMFLSEWED
jgi:hypothetical protein